jgi:hypothetical protein
MDLFLYNYLIVSCDWAMKTENEKNYVLLEWKLNKRNFTLSSVWILCAILDFRRLAPTNVDVETAKDDGCPCPFIVVTVRGFSSPSSVSSSSFKGIG